MPLDYAETASATRLLLPVHHDYRDIRLKWPDATVGARPSIPTGLVGHSIVVILKRGVANRRVLAQKMYGARPTLTLDSAPTAFDAASSYIRLIRVLPTRTPSPEIGCRSAKLKKLRAVLLRARRRRGSLFFCQATT